MIETTTKWDHVPIFLKIKKNILIRLHSSTFVYTRLGTRLHSSTLVQWLVCTRLYLPMTRLHSSTLVYWLVCVLIIGQNYQMILSMISKINFFNSNRDEKTVSLKNSKKLWRHSSETCTLKKRYVRANQASFINKAITKEILRWLRLWNKLINTKSEIDINAYNKQRNHCLGLIRKPKETFTGNINTNYVTLCEYFRELLNFFSQVKLRLI